MEEYKILKDLISFNTIKDKENKGSARTILKNNRKLIREKNLSIDINNYWKIDLIDQFYEIEI